ncbi:uncharacterized protein AC631_03817 [Debaryomyces fabryi]|uniref:amidase n=1 Tax=Debaryomyces fabryi TaxID=58627 RepID=A0A0V1PW13_9ASCO|nr:uncharacterized protein AC631_03817 [Debaryomyces fabryi]KSA00439.1 hypothetical protein AC631_03817 [Debaryomyces fabryi]CUM46484.1 unnamed protein product [Debaryomyces fabryi]
MTVKSWEDIVEAKRNVVKASIPSDWINDSIKEDMIQAKYINTYEYLDSILPQAEVDITSLTMLQLQCKIRKGELKALTVAKAYCHRAAMAQQILNCCSEIFFDKAFEQAKELDNYFEKKGCVVGPLHGIPISLKDQVDLPGIDSAIGYVALLNKPKTEISLLAEYLQKAGAVFYVKTTVPMAMLSPETVSNVHGYTLNASNYKLTSGGSSGGEGALIGAGASPMGFGTDIGGSIRIPSAFQGLHALKPSTGRISYLRVTNSYNSQETMPSAIGPMARSLADVEYITKLIIEWKLWEFDPKVVPIPYNDYSRLKQERLSFGIWLFDGQIKPHPPLQRALKQVIESLKAQGHEVIDINIPNSKYLETATEIFTADQGLEVLEMCKKSGEPIVKQVNDMIVLDLQKPALNVNEWWDLCRKHYEGKQDFAKLWNETANRTKSGKPIDGLICPVWPSCAYLPDSLNTLNYSCPFNFVDYPSVVLPVTKADKKLDPVQSDYIPSNDIDEIFHKYYDAELYDTMPVCLQVVGRQLQEEKTLVVASVVESCLKAYITC